MGSEMCIRDSHHTEVGGRETETLDDAERQHSRLLQALARRSSKDQLVRVASCRVDRPGRIDDGPRASVNGLEHAASEPPGDDGIVDSDHAAECTYLASRRPASSR